MAKSKTRSKPETALVEAKTAADAPITSRVQNGSPYQLDSAQVERAAKALFTNMKQHAQKQQEKTAKKSLVADEDEPEQNDETIFLTLTTKQHIKDSNRLKPSKIALPHPIQSGDVRICLLTADPQGDFKDLIYNSDSFPSELRAKVGRVVGLDKLKKKYKSYESRRQLQAEYDIFLADDRIITELARVLGKPFLSNKTKRPIPVTLAQQLPKDKDGKRSRVVKKSEEIAKEIENAFKCTYVHLSPSATTSVRIGRSSQSPQQIQDNVAAVVEALTDKFIPQGWRNVRGLYIKGPTTAALPIWLTDELWTSDEKVLEEPWKPTIKEGMSTRTSEKKRKWDEWEEEMLDEDELAEKRSRTRSRKAKKVEAGEKKELETISREKRKKLKQEALKSVQTPLIAG